MRSKNSKITFLKNKRGVLIGFAIVCILLSLLIIRLAYIQIINDEFYRAEATAQQLDDVTVSAKRGDIIDRNGTILATTIKSYTMKCNSKKMLDKYSNDEIADLAIKISDIIELESAELYSMFTSEKEEVKVVGYLTTEQVDKIKALRAVGFTYKRETKRYYPFGDFASQLLGSITVDNNGRSGLEAQYDQYLSGIDGRWIKVSDVNGNELENSTSTYYEPQDGLTLVTTIDSTIQYYVENIVREYTKKYNPKRIMCIVTDPNTNEILASVASDGFDPNNPYIPTNEEDKAELDNLSGDAYVNRLSQLWRNPIVSNTYELGSIFKLFVAAASLEESKINMTTSIYCPGYRKIDDDVLVCHDGTHGSQTVSDALANSCNVAFMTMGINLGKEKFYDYISAFGLDTLTGIDYQAEAYSQVKSKYSVVGVDLANMAFGQGIAISPIEYITAANATINGGYLLRPRYATALIDSEGNAVETYEKEIIRQVISEGTSNEMRETLEYTVNNGTSGKAYIAGYRVGGKTGTAQKAVNGKYGTASIISFYGAAPMDNPRVSVLVVIDETEEFAYAANVAAPFVKEVLEKTLPYLGVEAIYTDRDKNYNSTSTVTVPSVVGKTYEAAIGYLASRGFECKAASEEDEGTEFEVAAQYPLAGTKVTKGTTVYVYKG